MDERSLLPEIAFGTGDVEPDRQQDRHDADEQACRPEHGPFPPTEDRLLLPISHGYCTLFAFCKSGFGTCSPAVSTSGRFTHMSHLRFGTIGMLRGSMPSR